MRRSSVLWIIALLITLASAVYQRTTGPSYPARGKVRLGTEEIKYRLPRAQGDGDAEVRVGAASQAVQGALAWERFKAQDQWTYLKMERNGGDLTARLPHQPPAGKLVYRVILQEHEERVTLGGQPVVIRFKGEVPLPVLAVHVICMFAGMLLATRAGVEYFSPSPSYLKLIVWTIGLLTVGGLCLGPVVQKYAFGAYWTGWPFGTDLTDNKTLAVWLGWVIAWLKVRRNGQAGWWVAAAALVTLAVFAIPHSMLGSELKYE
ncbi:MAG: hypothetical protein HY858_02215 [Candidatus Solibacter usitatus]|nr:hypothetical protein [Candidatus Solibacter usitatus]